MADLLQIEDRVSESLPYRVGDTTLHRMKLQSDSENDRSKKETLPELSKRGAARKSRKKAGSRQKAGIPYWERLPLDVMAEIFKYCLPLSKPRVPSLRQAPYLLTQVCWAWYRIVLSLPAMWSTVALVEHRRSTSVLDLESGSRFLNMCITRTRGAPMELYLRAEFISSPSSFDQIQSISHRISRMTIIYPPASDPCHPPYFSPSRFLSTPNLAALEVYNREKYTAISESDLSHLQHIIKSSRALKYNVFCSRVSVPNGPIILHNMSCLEFLSLQEIIPLPFCFFLLRSIPTLRRLSLLHVVIDPEHAPTYSGNEALTSALSDTEMLQPLTHSRLQCLALAHRKGNPSLFFKFATLPQLQYVVIDHRSSEPVSWPQEEFMAFLERSDCKLKGLIIVDQPITSSQLVEILRLSNIGNVLESLSMQHYLEKYIIDDLFLEYLTLPGAAPHSQLGAESMAIGAERNTDLCIPCPNLEDISLFVHIDPSFVPGVLAMLNSRLSSNTVSPGKWKTLRRIQLDYHHGLKPHFGHLRRGGLILRVYEPGECNPEPIGRRQLRMLRSYLNGRPRPVVFEHNAGKWDALLLDE